MTSVSAPRAATCRYRPAPCCSGHAPHTRLFLSLPAAPPSGDLRRCCPPFSVATPRAAGPRLHNPGPRGRPASRPLAGAGAGPCAMT